MTLVQYALRYRNCSTDELCQFVRQRTGNLRRNMNRPGCVQKLRQLDREDIFRFLDLMPELRNNVYELLLKHNDEAERIKSFVKPENLTEPLPPASTAYPCLLRVCRQIHNEARGILYEQSAFFMDIESIQIDQRKTLSPRKTPLKFPQTLLSLRHITLHVLLDDHLWGWTATALRMLMRAFPEENALEKLKLVMQDNCRRVGDVTTKAFFVDLKELPATTELEFVGFTPRCENAVREMIGRKAAGQETHSDL